LFTNLGHLQFPGWFNLVPQIFVFGFQFRDASGERLSGFVL